MNNDVSSDNGMSACNVSSCGMDEPIDCDKSQETRMAAFRSWQMLFLHRSSRRRKQSPELLEHPALVRALVHISH